MLGVGDREARRSAGRQSFAISRHGTPSNAVSKRLQRVTQWMSWTSRSGSSLNSSQASSSSSSTSPKTRNLQAARSTFGDLAGVQDRPLLRHVLAGRQPRRVDPAARTFLSAIDLNIGVLH